MIQARNEHQQKKFTVISKKKKEKKVSVAEVFLYWQGVYKNIYELISKCVELFIS